MDGSLKPYRNYRKYTEDEIKSETDEYFDNPSTKKALPGMFGDKEDMEYHIKDSRLELLDMNELQSLKNTDIKEILSEPTYKARILRTLRLMKEYDKNYRRLFYAFSNLEKLPPPIVVRDKNNDLYLLAGNSRMMMGAAFGYNMPVKIINYSQEIVKEGKQDLKKLMLIAKAIVKDHKLKSKIKFGTGKNKGDYEWVSDTITLEQKPKSTLDFIESVLHECDHALMRKKYGPDKYELLYTRAGQLMVDKGKDFYWDNPFEVQARKYEKNAKKYIKKLNFR